MATQNFKRNLLLNLYREGKKISLVCFFLPLKGDKNVLHLQAISSIWRPLAFLPVTLSTGLEKVSFHSKAKECSNYHTIALISQTSTVMLKILQARLQQYVNHELHMFKLDLERQRDQRSNCQHLLDHQKRKRVP